MNLTSRAGDLTLSASGGTTGQLIQNATGGIFLNATSSGLDLWSGKGVSIAAAIPTHALPAAGVIIINSTAGVGINATGGDVSIGTQGDLIIDVSGGASSIRMNTQTDGISLGAGTIASDPAGGEFLVVTSSATGLMNFTSRAGGFLIACKQP